MTAEIDDIDQTNKRKLVTIRTINDLNPIEGADAIEVATVDGWKIVVKKGEFEIGHKAVYFEIDSFLPDGNPAWQFLVDKSARIFEGVKGHKLRTIKLRGQISQGLVLKLDQVPAVIDHIFALPEDTDLRQLDLSEMLGVVKWEASLPACLQGQAQGLFPSFIRKTDQERCQNLAAEIFGYEDRLVPFDVTPLLPEALAALQDQGILEWVGDGLGGKWMKTLRAKADPEARYEVSMKLDGSSMTVFARQNGPELDSGVCSRNLQLKVNEENADNAFVKMAVDTGLLRALQELTAEGKGNLAVQGELMGPNIQGNRENLKAPKFFIFDVQALDTGDFLTANERAGLMIALGAKGVDMQIVQHVPVLHQDVTLQELGLTSVEDLLAFAEGPSLVHAIREGLVFKRMDGKFSFKSISNQFLAKEKD
jgi:hypothetical protein